MNETHLNVQYLKKKAYLNCKCSFCHTFSMLVKLRTAALRAISADDNLILKTSRPKHLTAKDGAFAIASPHL